MSHKFCYLVLLFSFSSLYFFFFLLPLRLPLWPMDYFRVSFCFQMFREFPVFYYWFLAWYCCQRTHYFSSFKCVEVVYNPEYGFDMWSVAFWKECIFCYCWVFNKYLLDIVGWWVLLSFPISLMIFYLGILQIERGVFMSPTIIVDLSIHPFSLISFASHILQLLFGACIYLVLLCLLDGLSLLSLHNELLCLWLFSLPNLFYLMLI